MSFFSKIYTAFEDRILRNAPFQKVMVEAAMRRGVDDRISGKLKYNARNLQAQTMKQVKQAIAAATDPENPDFTLLADLYYNLMLDNHLRSIIESRILYVQRTPFKLVDDQGNENKDISWLLERPWYDDLVYKTLFSKWQGRTLLENYTLTPEGELAEITEIPQPYFNPAKGIITEAPGDATGWNYKEGVFADYYIQVGRDNDLGMLEKLAPIVLAKKLALGACQDYVDKYGVPPLFITTDREDQGRLDELYEAAANFKSNQFIVGRGSEKFEIGKDIGNGGVSPFTALAELANDEMSKAVLGGAGITDEKSFVGSAEIQFQLTKDRYESDKVFFKYFFNTHFKPRLIKLSSVYKPLEKYYLEWDNSETLNQQQMIDAITKLGSQYEIDTEFISQITGIPIIGTKSTTSLPGGEGEKK